MVHAGVKQQEEAMQRAMQLMAVQWQRMAVQRHWIACTAPFRTALWPSVAVNEAPKELGGSA